MSTSSLRTIRPILSGLALLLCAVFAGAAQPNAAPGVQLPAGFSLPRHYGECQILSFSDTPLAGTLSTTGDKHIERRYLVKTKDDSYVRVIETLSGDTFGMKSESVNEVIANEILIEIAPSVNIDSLRQKLEKSDMTLLDAVFQNRIFRVKINAMTLDGAETKLSEIRNWPEVTSADFNGIARPLNVEEGQLPTNDPFLYQQWWLEKIDAKGGWAVRQNAPNVKVAVIDTGADTRHEDLKFSDTYDCYYQTVKMSDPDGHGTHCAGVIGATRDNEKGGSGVAGKTNLVALKVTNAWKGLETAAILRAYDSALTLNVSIVSCSYGGSSYNSMAYKAIRQLRDSGIIMVAAAGNESANNDIEPNYPSNYDLDNIVAVAATDINDNPAEFTNYGIRTVDIAAPGVGVLSTHNQHPNDYTFMSGTSMATPCVAGILTLMKAQFPDSTYLEIISRLYVTADPVDALKGKIKHPARVNLAKALGGSPSADPMFGKVFETGKWVLSADAMPNTVPEATYNTYGVSSFGFYVPQKNKPLKRLKIELNIAGHEDIALRLITPTGTEIHLKESPASASEFSSKDFSITFDTVSRKACESYDYTGTFAAHDMNEFRNLLKGSSHGIWTLKVLNGGMSKAPLVKSVKIFIDESGSSNIPVVFGSQFNVNADDLGLPDFSKKPVVKGLYTDINGKSKKTAVKILKGFVKGDNNVDLEMTGKIQLYNKKTLRQYYADGKSAASFIALEQDTKTISLEFKIGSEISSYPQTLTVVPPVVDSIFANVADTVTVIGSQKELTVQGRFFGKKAPKAWLEYRNTKNGKTVKRSLKVPAKLFKFDKGTGENTFSVTAPKNFPYAFINGQPYVLVFDTGTALCAVRVIFQY